MAAMGQGYAPLQRTDMEPPEATAWVVGWKIETKPRGPWGPNRSGTYALIDRAKPFFPTSPTGALRKRENPKTDLVQTGPAPVQRAL